jgi:hypothetical protein
MQIREFSKPVTSKKLNESLAKKFGYKLNLEQFTEAQLEDVRNKLRTEMSQFELSENFDSLPSNGKYQKTRALLDVINQAILERADSKCDDCGHSPCDCSTDEEEAPKSEKTDEGYIVNTVRDRARQLSVPESWINKTIAQINLGEGVDREELKAELLTRYDLNESAASWLLLEGEEEKAETILATKDMVDRVTGWLEDVAAMKAEQLLELMDSIRETQGSETAQQWSDSVKPALEAVYTALETSRQGIQQGLGILSGEQVDTMGSGAPAMGASAPEAAPELGAPEEETDLGMDLPAEEAGRMKRENVEYSRRLGILLNSKKK